MHRYVRALMLLIPVVTNLNAVHIISVDTQKQHEVQGEGNVCEKVLPYIPAVLCGVSMVALGCVGLCVIHAAYTISTGGDPFAHDLSKLAGRARTESELKFVIGSEQE